MSLLSRSAVLFLAMGTTDDDLFAPPPSTRRRLEPWNFAAPLVTAPILYTLRFALKGRVAPSTQHKIFLGVTLLALSHAGYIMSSDNSLGGGGVR
jgi:hypothetical protein